MKSVEEEFEEIASEWDVNYLDQTGDYLYVVELKKEELILKLSVPDAYPEVGPEFAEKEMKIAEEKMQVNLLRMTQQTMSANLGKPMIGLLLGTILKQVNSVGLQKDEKSLENVTVKAEPPLRRGKKKKPKYRIACSFGLAGSNQAIKDLPDDNVKSPGSNVENTRIQGTIGTKPKGPHHEPKVKGKAPPMKTAKDVINRLKWDDKLKNEEFTVGYEDRFDGIIEVPVFKLNWEDDIASTGPADKLVIPEHRVQYFKFLSEKVWEKSSKTDLIFGSTGSKVNIVTLVQKLKDKKRQSDEKAAEVLASGKTEQSSPLEAKCLEPNDLQKDKAVLQNITVEVDHPARGVVPEPNTAREAPTMEAPDVINSLKDMKQQSVAGTVNISLSRETEQSSPADVKFTGQNEIENDEGVLPNSTLKFDHSEKGAYFEPKVEGETCLMETEDNVSNRSNNKQQSGGKVVEVSLSGETEQPSPLKTACLEPIDIQKDDGVLQNRTAESDDSEKNFKLTINKTADKTSCEIFWESAKDNTAEQPWLREQSKSEISVCEDDKDRLHSMNRSLSGAESDIKEVVDWLLDRVNAGIVPESQMSVLEEVESGIRNDIEVLNAELPHLIDGLDIDDNGGNSREVSGAGEKRKHDSSRSYSAHGHHDKHHSRQTQDHRGNKKSRRDDGRDERRRDRGSSRWERERPGNWQKPNYCICIELDERSMSKLSEVKDKLNSTLGKGVVPSPEHFHMEMATLCLQSQEYADELCEVLKYVCPTWSPCEALIDVVRCDHGKVKALLSGKRLKSLFFKLQRSFRTDVRKYYLHFHPHIKMTELQDDNGRDRIELPSTNLSLMVTNLYVKQIGMSDVNDHWLVSENFYLERGNWRNSQTGQRGQESFYHGLEHGPSHWTPDRGNYYEQHVVKHDGWETSISKRLSAILRHQAMGFKLDQEGFVEVNRLLSHKFFRVNQVNEEDIERIVANNAKKRFCLEGPPGKYKIRANQGHTVQVEDLELEEITDPKKFPKVVHGTKLDFWDSIRRGGLHRMRRNHIHMTTAEPHSDEEVISGMRNSSNCFVYINIMKAMEDGVKFYLSKNGVILTEGVDGILEKKYFSHAIGIGHGRRFELRLDEECKLPNDSLREESSSRAPEKRNSQKPPPSPKKKRSKK